MLWTVDHTSSITCSYLPRFNTGSKLSYTAWRERRKGASNLPMVFVQQCSTGSRTCDLPMCYSTPGHTDYKAACVKIILPLISFICQHLITIFTIRLTVVPPISYIWLITFTHNGWLISVLTNNQSWPRLLNPGSTTCLQR